jgi:ADP-ribose pyrophosphatase YjhB (NUDIX family)
MMTLLEISRELAALAQAGIAYSKDHFDIGRFERIRGLAGEMLSADPATAGFAWPVETGYPTPKVDTRGAIFDDAGRILMIREVSSGLWTLPGGWADVNASPRENVERECLEETGFLVEATRLCSVIDRDRAGYPANPHTIYKMFFLCTIIGGQATTSVESSEVRFFPMDELPLAELDTARARHEDILHAHAVFKGDNLTTGFN